jgi:hypothetical protein
MFIARAAALKLDELLYAHKVFSNIYKSLIRLIFAVPSSMKVIFRLLLAFL